jgi:hypothetical protein
MALQIKTKKAGVLLTVLAIAAIVFATFASGILGSETENHLFVDATYLLKTSETINSVNVTCTLYLTNTWMKESKEIKTIAYVIETKDNLAVFKNTQTNGKIMADSTDEIELPLLLSNSSYKVEILIFENEKLVTKGIITISAYSHYYWDDITLKNKQVWEISSYASDFQQVH